jgi:hypothetical protein
MDGLMKLVLLGRSSPLLGDHGHHHCHYTPSLSNALIAAFKHT